MFDRGWWQQFSVAAVVGILAGSCPLLGLATDRMVETSVAEAPELDDAPQATQDAVFQRLQADISYLASDELAGRDVGTPGLQLAADYIAASFAEAGLDTTLFDGTPWQTFSIPINTTITDQQHNRLQITLQDAPQSAADEPAAEQQAATPDPSPDAVLDGVLEQNFVPLAIGGNGTVSARLVFAGYGISAPELGYDDYAGIDVQGAVVMVLRKEPQGPEADKRFDGDRNSKHAFFDAKIKAAAAHGAAAVLLVNDPDSVAGMIAALDRRRTGELQSRDRLQAQLDSLPAAAENARRGLQDQLQQINGILNDFDRQNELAAEGLLGIEEAGRQPVDASLPVASLGQSLADRLLRRQLGKSLAEIKQQIDDQVQPHSHPLSANVLLATELTPAKVDSSNVLGMLPGRGNLADQTIVVGAHYDHVGMGGVGSLAPGTVAIHNGADDNASGTSILLSSVRAIRDQLQDSEHHRRVLFIAFTGEERGLLGSEHYVTHPRFPLSDTVAMVNLDMVGRLRNNDLTVYGVGTAPEFSDLLDRVNQHTQFELFKVASGYGPSDHQSFFTRKVPVLFFFTGLHNDYHRPSDKIDKINLTGMVRITDITSRVVGELATAPQRPGYQDTDRSVQIRQQESSQAHLGVSLREVPAERVASDPVSTPPTPTGAMVSAVADGSAAADVGIRSGDRLLRIGGLPIGSLSDVIAIVSDREVGDTLEIDLERDDQRLQFQATLKRRPAANR